MTLERITILGTGLVGTSVGLALRAHGYRGAIAGWDRDPKQLQIAVERGAVSEPAQDAAAAIRDSGLVVLSGPVFAIIGWMEQLSGLLRPWQMVTDVGSTKRMIAECAARWYNQPGRAGFLPGHPMAGKEVSGAANADAELFDGATWIFTPLEGAQMEAPTAATAAEWRAWVEKLGCRILDMNATRHDELCAWVSHLPQMVATALSALLEDRFGDAGDLRAIGGRGLREMTRLGSSPYSMWRDIAHTNSDAIAATLLALEQRLAHLRENLKTPELRAEFETANRFRLPGQGGVSAGAASQPRPDEPGVEPIEPEASTKPRT